MTDIFEEVEEEVRRAHYEALWKKYGQYIIAGAVVVVAGIAAWQWYQYYQNARRGTVSNAYQAAETLAQTGKYNEAENAFGALAASAPDGYKLLAKFRQAEMLQYENKNDMAAALYGELAAGQDADLAASAKLRLGWLHAESQPRATVEKDLAGLTGTANPWRFAANEILAYADLKNGRRADAISAYKQLSQDSTAPQGVRVRASAIVEYLNANPDDNPTAEPAPAAATAPAPAPAAAAPSAADSNAKPANPPAADATKGATKGPGK